MEESTQAHQGLSRRAFVSGLGIAALGAGLAGCAPSPKGSAEETRADAQTSGEGAAQRNWDRETDILVCGSGTVAFAGLAAVDAGSSAIIVEKDPSSFGGTSVTSSGTFWLPLSYPQMEAGVKDGRENVIAYITDVSEGRSTDAVIASFVDNSAPFAEWAAQATGVEFVASGTADYVDGSDGYMNGGRSVKPDCKTGEYWAAIRESFELKGGEVLMGAAVRNVVRDENGAVIGAEIEQDGKILSIKADAVILGTGGFDHNAEMRAKHLPFPIYATNATPNNTGDAHLIGARIGADLALMDCSWGLMNVYAHEFDPAADIVFDTVGQDWAAYRGRPNAMVVNRQGKRFADEAADYASFQRTFGNYDTATLDLANIPAFLILDSTFLQYYKLPGMAEVGDPVPDYFASAPTIAELAEKLGIDPEGLAAEVEKFNGYCEEGVDPEFHRGEKLYSQNRWASNTQNRDGLKNMCLAPVETAPFYGCVYLPMTCGTCGGLRINENGQVLSVDGEPIAGLYAAGNCTASITGVGYTGAGGTLGPGAVMAYVGARHALGL